MTEIKKENKDESFISIITILNSFTYQNIFRINELQNNLENNYTDYEIIIIAQKKVQTRCSKEIEYLLKNVPCVRYLQLASDVNSDVAWSAGLENAIGDFIITFDLSRDPIFLISNAIKLSKQGNDVVVGTAPENVSFLYKLIRPLSGRLLNLIDYHLPPNATSFRCLSRRAANAVIDTGKFYQQFFMQIQKTGYSYITLPYTAKKNNKKRTIFNGIKTTLRLMVFNSSLPLRMMSVIGFTGSFLACLFSLYSIIINLFKNDVVTGWTSTIFFISLLFAIQFIILSFISEYLNRILEEQSNKTSYSIIFEKNSSVMIDLDRINVLELSTSPCENKVQTGRNK